eukprot:SAG11_NODE_2191_length_3706_cov_2.096756_8_plen_66_part_00
MPLPPFPVRSPLNVTLDSFSSLFPDVDAPFGSAGSFFDFAPQAGAFGARDDRLCKQNKAHLGFCA